MGVGLGMRDANEADKAMAAALTSASRAMPMGAPLPLPPGRDVTEVPAFDSASLDGIPPYPHASPRKLGDDLASQGSKLAISWFSTQDKPSEVIAFYDREYSRSGVMHATHMFDETQGYVAWLDPPVLDAGLLDGTMHMVSVAVAGHETLVFASSSHPLELLKAATQQLPPGMRLPDGATSPVVVNQSQEGVHRLSVYSQLKHATVADVARFFEEHFKTGSWSIIERTEGPERAGLTAQRGQILQSVMLSKKDDGVDMMLTYDERPHSPLEDQP